MEWIKAILPSIIVGVFMFCFEQKQKQRDTDAKEHSSARKQETLLALEMQMSTAKLSYATAIALKRGYANGEVEEGIKAYELSKKKYVDFLNEQATEYLSVQ